MTREEFERVLERVYDVLPPKEAVTFKVEQGSSGLFDTKLGGTPYFPKSMDFPTVKGGIYDGKPLRLLAQLNFEKLPHIKGYPEKGILQFFCSSEEDGCYGFSLEQGKAAEQEGFRVIYHEKIITDASELMSADDIPASDGDVFPLEGSEFRLVCKGAELIYPTFDDYRFHEAFVKCHNEISDTPIKDFYGLDDEFFDMVYAKNKQEYDAFIGGYPTFTQEDPRPWGGYADCDTVLFELLSTEDIDAVLWGDLGTGTFLIPEDRLKNRDFSRVLYNFDCS